METKRRELLMAEQCQPGDHMFDGMQTCRRCGWTKRALLDNARQTLRLASQNELGRDS